MIKLYGPFFDLHNWHSVLTNYSSLAIIFSLVLLECILSIDNSIVLAVKARSLNDGNESRKALFYGLWGAYLFRFMLIGIGVYLIHFWWIKILGAIYLGYVVHNYFFSKHNKTVFKKDSQKDHSFWKVILQIELMDIMFSVDSILSALAISSNPVIVLLGGLIGILCMRGISSLMIRLMRKVPELEKFAYLIISIIAIKLFLSIPLLNIEISSEQFAGLVLVILMVPIVKKFMIK